MVSLLACIALGVFGIAHGQNLIESGSTTATATSCMVCNTNVNVPTPSCGVSATEAQSLKMKLDQLERDTAALKATSCCSGKVAAAVEEDPAKKFPTPQYIGHFTHYRRYGRYDSSKQWTFVDRINATRVKYSDAVVIGMEVFIDDVAACDIRIGVFKLTSEPCGLVMVRHVDIAGSRINARNSSTTVYLTAAERASMTLDQGDFLGFSYINGGCVRFEYINHKETDLSKRPKNYCQGLGTAQDNQPISLAYEIEKNRGNRQYSLKIFYDHKQ